MTWSTTITITTRKRETSKGNNYCIHLFTDRRFILGQIVYFKGIVLESKRKNGGVKAGIPSTSLFFADAHRKMLIAIKSQNK